MAATALFYFFSLAAILSGLMVITRQSPIASALSLVVCFFCLAADYVLLDAHFVAVIQLLVYAGAIMVLFIFVIMLLNLRSDEEGVILQLGRRALMGASAAGLLGVGMLAGLAQLHRPMEGEVPADYGTIFHVGTAMFGSTYLLPFELVSALLTVAMVGAVVLAKKEI